MEVFERLDNERKCIVFVIDIVVGDVKEEFKIKFLNKVSWFFKDNGIGR